MKNKGLRIFPAVRGMKEEGRILGDLFESDDGKLLNRGKRVEIEGFELEVEIFGDRLEV